jgi:hypothetical protein
LEYNWSFKGCPNTGWVVSSADRWCWRLVVQYSIWKIYPISNLPLDSSIFKAGERRSRIDGSLSVAVLKNC